MDRLAYHLTFIGLLACIGCGSDSQLAEKPPVASQGPANQTVPTAPSPTDVVSQFLDEIRRGGEDSRANELLSERARSELQRIGRSVQPIGSPDAGFTVTRAESVPSEPGSALVHSVWSEPNGDGSKNDFQVVWAVQKETGQWRISGMAMELDPEQAPVIIDFENGDLMAKLLASPEDQQTNEGAAESRAAAPDSNISR